MTEPDPESPDCGTGLFPERDLFTERLSLTLPARADADEIAALANDIGIAAMTARLPHPYGVADALAFIAAIDGEAVRVLRERRTGAVCGVGGMRPSIDGRSATLGYWLGRPYWRRGLGTEAAQALVDFAFETSAIECVWGSCRVVNGASRRVLEKCGFQMRRLGTMDTVAAGRVASEDYHLDRGAWAALKGWRAPQWA